MWDNIKSFWAQPYSYDMDAWHWFGFLGLLIIFAGAWGLILKHITEAV